MIRILGTVFAGLLGLAFGSFLNVCLTRWPQGESIVTPRSHCRNCGHTLAWWENIPLLSWLALRGRCRNCHARIGWRYPLVELALGTLWASTAWHFMPEMLDLRLPRFCAYYGLVAVAGMFVFYWLLVALAALDAENFWLPNWITFPGIILGFFDSIAKATLDAISPFHDTVTSDPFEIIRHETGQAAISSLFAILSAAALILLIRWLYKLIRHREGIGLGDAKLMALLAAWLGLPGALLAFGLGVVLGAIFAVASLAIPTSRTESQNWAASKLPLGTFLCIGGIVSALWGEPIIAAYRRWAGI